MANRCDKCDKTKDYGHNVSHAKNRTKTTRKPNLHRATVMIGGKKTKVKYCTKCLRTAERPKREEEKVEKVVRTKKVADPPMRKVVEGQGKKTKKATAKKVVKKKSDSK